MGKGFILCGVCGEERATTRSEVCEDFVCESCHHAAELLAQAFIDEVDDQARIIADEGL